MVTAIKILVPLLLLDFQCKLNISDDSVKLEFASGSVEIRADPRTAKLVKCESVPGFEKLYAVEVETGTGGTKSLVRETKVFVIDARTLPKKLFQKLIDSEVVAPQTPKSPFQRLKYSFKKSKTGRPVIHLSELNQDIELKYE